MGLRLLRKILIPFAALVMAAVVGTLLIGRTHASTTGAGSSNGSGGISLTAQQSDSTAADLQQGYELFQAHCSSCHGAEANGSQLAPNLQGLGPGVVSLWLSTGWMPLKTPTAQPDRKPAFFNSQQVRQIAMWVASLRPGGTPFAPTLDLGTSNLSSGFNLFTLNCAPCHTITGAGDALADGYFAPGLHGVTRAEIWEAVRSGPQNMPQFSSKNITPSQLNDIIKYVSNKIEHPSSPGGLSLGGVGPVAEGFVGLFAGVGACLVAAYWVGDRTEREEEDDHDGHGPGEGDDGEGGEAAHAGPDWSSEETDD